MSSILPSVYCTIYCFAVEKLEILLRLIFNFFFCEAKGLKLRVLSHYFFSTPGKTFEIGTQYLRFAKILTLFVQMLMKFGPEFDEIWSRIPISKVFPGVEKKQWLKTRNFRPLASQKKNQSEQYFQFFYRKTINCTVY